MEKNHRPGTRTTLVPGLLLVFLTLALLAVVLVAQGAEAAPNLEVASGDIEPSVPEPTRGTTTKVTVTVDNTGDANASGFHVKLRDVTASEDIGTLGPYNLPSGGTLRVQFTWDLTSATGGKHTLRATVDPEGAVTESSETDNVADRDVNVNLPPTAKASSDFSSAMSLLPIKFSASGSSDSDGSITQYLWYFGDGYTASGYNVTHTYTDGGLTPGKRYNVTLVVADNDGGVGQHTISVQILNRRPTAVAKGATIKTVTPTSVSGASSTDDDGRVVRYQWTLHNGTILWGSPAVVSYPDDGAYSITLTVWDDDGALDSVIITMIVMNQEPYVIVRANRTLVGAGQSIRFDASASEDVDGSIASMTWIFGDGNTASGEIVDHIFSRNGSYNVTLVAVDDDGALATFTVRVIVGNTPPLAVANADSASVLTYEYILFSGNASSDPDDNIATYSWDFGDGRSARGVTTLHRFIDDGTYDVTLTVTDSGGAFSTSTITVVVLNRPPVANFTDLEVMTGEAALLSGSMCTDMDGYVASYLWDLGGGLVYTTANATHTWESPGLHVVTLRIWDDDGAVDETTFNVTVNNRIPVAVATAIPLKTTLAHPVTFNGSGSYDLDGEVINWSWALGDGSRAYGAIAVHTYAAYGTYLVTLTVRDDSGGVNSTTVLVTVRNQPPVAVLNITPTSALTGEAITFDASGSSDPENEIALYYWSFGDGQSADGKVVSHSYADDGRYTVRLTVVDKDQTSAFVEGVVRVGNRPPKAMAQVSPGTVDTLSPVSFTSVGSADVDGRILWYRWRFGDGTEAFGPSVTHSFADDGVYQVTLVVTDDDGGDATTTVEVEVKNRPPVSVAGPDLSTRSGIPVRLDGRSSYDMDGQVVSYHWAFGDGTSASGSVVTHAFPKPELYLVELTVTDDDGASSKGNLTVLVENVAPVAAFTGETTVLSGQPVSLDGRASYDLDGNIAEHTWDLGDGTVELGQLVEHTYSSIGVYLVRLTVEDEGGLKSYIEFKVTVLNRMPTASILASDTVLITGDTLDLDGSGSRDPEGAIATYTWILGDGAMAYGPKVSHVYQDNGIYMVVLTVTDGAGGTDSTSVFVQVENRSPLAAIEGPTSTLTLVELIFTAEGSRDPDGQMVGFFWDFGDGAGSNGWEVNHTFMSAGQYTVRLTVMDDDGKTSSTNVTIVVTNRLPQGTAAVASRARVNSTVLFDADGSFDPDGLISAWEWEFGDGETGEGIEAYHKYMVTGSYEWKLTVIDDWGDTHEVSGTIIVDPKEPGPGNGNGGGEDEDEGGLLPGPSGAMMALAMVLVALFMVAARRRRSG